MYLNSVVSSAASVGRTALVVSERFISLKNILMLYLCYVTLCYLPIGL